MPVIFLHYIHFIRLVLVPHCNLASALKNFTWHTYVLSLSPSVRGLRFPRLDCDWFVDGRDSDVGVLAIRRVAFFFPVLFLLLWELAASTSCNWSDGSVLFRQNFGPLVWTVAQGAFHTCNFVQTKLKSPKVRTKRGRCDSALGDISSCIFKFKGKLYFPCV